MIRLLDLFCDVFVNHQVVILRPFNQILSQEIITFPSILSRNDTFIYLIAPFSGDIKKGISKFR